MTRTLAVKTRDVGFDRIICRKANVSAAMPIEPAQESADDRSQWFG
jgi:hypothetical protein